MSGIPSVSSDLSDKEWDESVGRASPWATSGKTGSKHRGASQALCPRE